MSHWIKRGVLIMLSSLLLAGAHAAHAQVTLTDSVETKTERDFNAETAQYDVFQRPPVGWVGDVMPMAEGDTMHLFYLQDWRDNKPTYHPIHQFTTKDVVNYEYKGETIPLTDVLGLDPAIGTGSFTKVGDTYHAFYTGHNWGRYQLGYPREYIRHAVSKDLVNWEKLDDEVFYAPEGYDPHNFRDPNLFWNEAGQEWWLLITGIKDGDGVVVRYRSNDLKNWELMDPLFTLDGQITECLDLFKWGDWWYLIYSSEWWTQYVRAKTLDGPWEKPAMLAFDGHAYYAAKSALLGENRYLFGWIATRGGYTREFKDTSDWDWAGNLAVHQLMKDEQDYLYVVLPETIRMAFGEPVPIKAQVLCGEAEVTGENTLRISCDKGENGGVTFGNLPKDQAVMISVDIILEKDTRAAGFSFGSANYMQAYGVELDMKHELLRYDGSLVARMRYSAEKTYIYRDIEKKYDTPYHLDVIIDQDIAVFYLNGREALSTRIYKMPQAPFGLYVTDGTATFDNLTIRLFDK